MADANPSAAILKALSTMPVPRRRRRLPLRVGTRSSPLALVQTRMFLAEIRRFCPILRDIGAFDEQAMSTTGDQVQDRPLAAIGGKGLFAKEIHEALLDERIDFAVHSLKDLETSMPDGIVLAATLKREDCRDAVVLGPRFDGFSVDRADPYAAFPEGAHVGTASVRRQAQLLHARPDLRVSMIRGNVQTRLAKVERGDFDASLLALAGLKRLALDGRASFVIDPDVMVPAACQGIVGVTVREEDVELRELLAAIEDGEARAVSTAERALLASLDGSCRTPIGGYASLLPPDASGTRVLHLTGLVARADGSFLLRRSRTGPPSEAAALGRALGDSLRADSPADIFAA